MACSVKDESNKAAFSRVPVLAVIGGFPGAGKTTLLLKAADILKSKGVRVAIILNDQGTGLVDTQMAISSGFAAEEVAGACFCCPFSYFVDAASRLAAFRPDVILVSRLAVAWTSPPQSCSR